MIHAIVTFSILFGAIGAWSWGMIWVADHAQETQTRHAKPQKLVVGHHPERSIGFPYDAHRERNREVLFGRRLHPTGDENRTRTIQDLPRPLVTKVSEARHPLHIQIGIRDSSSQGRDIGRRAQSCHGTETWSFARQGRIGASHEWDSR